MRKTLNDELGRGMQSLSVGKSFVGDVCCFVPGPHRLKSARYRNSPFIELAVSASSTNTNAKTTYWILVVARWISAIRLRPLIVLHMTAALSTTPQSASGSLLRSNQSAMLLPSCPTSIKSVAKRTTYSCKNLHQFRQPI